MVHNIVRFGTSVLREKALRVEKITDEIKSLVADMLDSMAAARGVGLAAEQIGRTEAVCVIDVPADADCEANSKFNSAVAMPLVMINPEIKESSGNQRGVEGCLSFPDIFIQVTRPAEVSFEYTSLDGERHVATVRGLLARAVLHECEHLNGILLVDKMSSMQRIANSGKLRRLTVSS